MVRFFQGTETDDEECNLKKLADNFRPTLVLWEIDKKLIMVCPPFDKIIWYVLFLFVLYEQFANEKGI